MTVLAATSPSPLWYLTRGSGVVTLLLLTVSVCLGIATTRGWRSERVPRFVVAGLHRNLTLLAIVFLSIHVGTTVGDRYTPIGIKDAFVPFLSPYRPVWLGLGALACDLLLALVITSLLRARLGYRVWRLTHWLAYASWPLALVHGLGTGTDARFGWMTAVGAGCLALVVAALTVRVAATPAGPRRLGVVAAAIAAGLAIVVWYRAGPAQHGWAARAGTPSTLLQSKVAATLPQRTLAAATAIPSSFDASLTGRVTESAPDGAGLVTIRIDTALHGGLTGRLRFALRGFPTEEGGVSMTSSGVAFRSRRSPLYEGSIVGLDGTRVSASLAAGSAGRLDLTVVLQLDRSGGVTGVVHGIRSGQS